MPRVRELPGEQRSLGAKVTAREQGVLSRPGLLPERARIAEVARDTEASETCKRLCVLPEGLARDAEYCRLEKGCLLLCGSPGEACVSCLRSPGDQSVRVLLTCCSVAKLDIATERLQEVCRMLDGAGRRRKEATRIRTQRQNREKTLPCRSKQVLLQKKEGGV